MTSTDRFMSITATRRLRQTTGSTIRRSVPREALIRNNFGGAIGGPIVKDRFFFFFNYEGFRESRGATAVREVPLPGVLGSGSVRYVAADPNAANTTPCPSATQCESQMYDTHELHRSMRLTLRPTASRQRSIRAATAALASAAEQVCC